MQRRELLKLIAAAPAFGAAGQLMAAPAAEGAKLLVVFLRGAYDCSNLLVPTSSDFYYASRPNIAIPRPGTPNGALPLDGNWGLHPALAQSVMPMFQQKQASFIAFAGTDATRVASYNPWVSLSWLVTGKTVGGLQITPQRNLLDREQALRMWTENVTWFSNEEGKKGRIQAGQLADLVVPDRDFFACAESDIADTTALLTMVGGKVVYGAGVFAAHDEGSVPPAMPDWSPARTFGGYAGWADKKEGAPLQKVLRNAAMSCGCANNCNVHGHGHATAWSSKLPVVDLKSFWGALGCACWAV